MKLLEAPAILRELSRQPVQQFRVSRQHARGAEVFGRGDDAAAKILLPHAVNDDSCSQWMIGTPQPFGERRAIAIDGSSGRRFWQIERMSRIVEDGKHSGTKSRAGRLVVASAVNVVLRRRTHVPKCL